MKEKTRVIDVSMPEELDEVLNTLARSFRIAKVDIIRRAIYSYLQEIEAVSTAFTYNQAPTRTSGRLGDEHHERKK